ncbi:hypothetical protein [Fibrobacter succinogenes]|uniref:Lipoprotein n=1 Tax=Fibrobacter succinogenes TaxID=833 RepID=A0A380S5F9_FIBSU|nr:hypothetical protein [Fibrobacter succinogenes]PWJ35802.1 hypothetical protein IE02_1859 [Fibrobacter succinogenes subsp. elongatus]SUQ24457.1 hypothetical protein SAMN05661053_1859 [Fibrobacter succinogenes]
MNKYLSIVFVLLFVACSDENPINNPIDVIAMSSDLEQSSSSENVQSSSAKKGVSSSSKELSKSSSSVRSSSSAKVLSSSSVFSSSSSSASLSSSAEIFESSSSVQSSSSVVLESSSSEVFSSSSVTISSSSEVSSSSVYVKVCGPEPSSLDLEEVFENQSKAAYPDTSEYQIKIYINSPGVLEMNFGMAILTAGPDKSITTVKNNLVQTETVRNNGRIKVTDLKTGKVLPLSDAETNLMDFRQFVGTPEDYSGASFEDGLWKLSPKDDAGKILYYSACEERIMKIFYVSGDTVTTMNYSYFDELADFPGTVKSMNLERSVYLRDAAMRDYIKSDSMKVFMEWSLYKIKQRHLLPEKLFDIN